MSELNEEMVENVQETMEEQPQQETQEEVVQEETPKQTSEQENLARLRELRKQAEYERDEAYRLLQEQDEYIQSQATPSPVKEPEPELELSEDEILEGRHLKNTEKKFLSHIDRLEKKLQEYEHRSTETQIEIQLKKRYPDFENVVCTQNLNELRKQYPEIADSLNANPDLYNKASSAYTLIKKLGIESGDTYANDKLKAHANAAKPRPVNSIAPQQGSGPLSKANAFAGGELTDDVKDQLYKEMLAAARNR